MRHCFSIWYLLTTVWNNWSRCYDPKLIWCNGFIFNVEGSLSACPPPVLPQVPRICALVFPSTLRLGWSSVTIKCSGSDIAWLPKLDHKKPCSFLLGLWELLLLQIFLLEINHITRSLGRVQKQNADILFYSPSWMSTQ